MKEKGITLVALVITIVILIILTGISINLIFGENGVIIRATDGKILQKVASIKEEIQLEISDIEIIEKENNKKMDFSTKLYRVYNKLEQKGLTKNTERVGNLLIIEKQYVVFLTRAEDTIQADTDQWSYNIEGNIAKVYNYKGSNSDITIPTYVKENGIIYPITKLQQTWNGENGRFYGSTIIKSIEILDNIEEIDTWVFSECSNLEKVILPESITKINEGLFSKCKNLKTINIPSSVKEISKEAFSFCVGFEQIDIPSTVEEIGDCAFGYCGNREPVYLGADFENSALSKITLHEGLNRIGQEAFRNAMSVEYDLKIPSSVSLIGKDAFLKYGTVNNKKTYQNDETYGSSEYNLKSKIQASFFECYMGNDFSEADWEEEIKEWKEMGMKYIVIGETMFKSSTDNQIYTYYPSKIPGTKMYYSAVEKILKHCKQANIKVFLSCGNDENTYKYNLCKHDSGETLGQESFIQSIEGTLPFIQELYDLYYNDYKDTLYGWYFTPEVSNSIDWEDSAKFDIGVETLSKGLNITIEKIRSLNKDFKIMLSPYLNVEEQASWCTRDEKVISRYWKEVINKTNFIEEDVFAPQDSANNMKWDVNKLTTYTKAYRDAVDNANKKIQLWSNLEMFIGYENGKEDTEYIEYGQSTYLTYLDKQLKSQSPYVDNFMSCSFCYYYTKPNSIDGFYEAYKKYLQTGIIETEKPTAPTDVEVGTVKVNGNECLNVNFSGMKDNYGIARANIYKNGNLYTYRVSTRLNTYKLDHYIGREYPRSFFDKNFNLQDDTATYEIEVIDCCENKSDNKLKFTVTSKNGNISVIKD